VFGCYGGGEQRIFEPPNLMSRVRRNSARFCFTSFTEATPELRFSVVENGLERIRLWRCRRRVCH